MSTTTITIRADRRRADAWKDDEMTGPIDDSTSTARMRAAASAANAFWAALAAAFPKASSGDLTPGQVIDWEKARDEAVSAWIANNVPSTSADGRG